MVILLCRSYIKASRRYRFTFKFGYFTMLLHWWLLIRCLYIYIPIWLFYYKMPSFLWIHCQIYLHSNLVILLYVYRRRTFFRCTIYIPIWLFYYPKDCCKDKSSNRNLHSNLVILLFFRHLLLLRSEILFTFQFGYFTMNNRYTTYW